MRPVEDVAVLEDVGLEREHLLHSQRPLLIPRSGKAQRLVPRRQLDRPRACPFRQRDAEHLEHDALHVVLGLGLGQAQRVHLHAVAEPACLRVLDAVALDADAVPHLGHRPQLADLLDEPDPGVDEERDRREHAAEAIGCDLSRVAHRVEHADRRRHRVGDLLHRRGARFLQVVRADVDRVPSRRVLSAPGDHVDDQTARRTWWEYVRAARQVLLDDVVLRRPAQLVGAGALLLGVGDIQRQQPRGRGVDRHRRVHLPGRNAVEQHAHVAQVTDRHADLADLAFRHRGVGVVADLRGQVERDREAGLALGEVVAVELVRCASRRVARVRPHQPGRIPRALGVAHPSSVVARNESLKSRPVSTEIRASDRATGGRQFTVAGTFSGRSQGQRSAGISVPAGGGPPAPSIKARADASPINGSNDRPHRRGASSIRHG